MAYCGPKQQTGSDRHFGQPSCRSHRRILLLLFSLISPAIIFLDNSSTDENIRLKKEWKDNYQITYSSDQAYPEKFGRLAGSGTLRRYSYALVSICPFKYYPISKKLFYYNSIKITINYDLSNPNYFENIILDNIANEKAASLFFNYDQMKDLYKSTRVQPVSLKETYDA